MQFVPGCSLPRTRRLENALHPVPDKVNCREQPCQRVSPPLSQSWTPLLPTPARLPWPGAVRTIWVEQHSKEEEILSTGGMITF